MGDVSSRRLPLVGRCAAGGAAGFIAATVASPFVFALTGAGRGDFPTSALDPRTVVAGALVGAVAIIGLLWALDGTVRRALVVVQGVVGFCLAGLVLVAHRDDVLLGLPLAGAVAGAALGSAAPGGVLLGALVGGSTFPMAAMFVFAGAWHPALGVLGGILGVGAWGGSMGATVGWCEETAGRGWSWPALLVRPAGVAGALALLVPAQVAAAAVVLRRDPPALCFDSRTSPAGRVLEAVDVDADGDLDAIDERGGEVRLLRNAGGVLSPEPVLPGAADAVVGDADADGDVDVAALVPERGRSSVVLNLNDGRGGFVAGPRVALDVDQPGRITMVDLDGDRAADLVAPGKDGLVVLWSRGGRLDPGPRLPHWRHHLTADVDADGRTDLVSFESYQGVAVHRMTGAARFESWPVSFGEYITDVTFADVDGDGDGDLVVGAISEVVVMGNDGTGHFSPARTLPGGRDNSAVRAGDVDGDRDLDLIALEGPRGEQLEGPVWAWANTGAGRWSDVGRLGSTDDGGIVADLTGDGRADILSGSSLLVSRPC